MLFGERFQDNGDHVTQQSHHGKVVLDKAKFNIQAHILIDVARGVVWPGTEDPTDLEDTPEDSHHHLLVKLPTLRQVCGTPKVVQFEDIGAALRRRGNDLRLLYLGASPREECAAETCHDAGPEPEDRTSRRVAVRDSRVIKQRAGICWDLAFVQRNRRCFRDGRDYFDLEVM